MDWDPPDDWISITAIDAHTGGEPLRIYTGGYPVLKGATILDKRRHAMSNFDHLRTATMWEPRGHADMYGCLVTEPVTPDGHFGVLFLHNEGYSSMCGHGIIAVTKVVLETGMLNLPEDIREVKIDTPAGRVISTPHWKNGRVAEVSFLNVPSFVYAFDQQIDVPGLGLINYDIAFGGAFYAFVRAEEVEVELNEKGFRRLIELGVNIKQAVMDRRKVVHPFEEDLSFLYGVIFVGKAYEKENHSRNVCIFADGEVDRSPTGTGVSARTALQLARNELKVGESFTVESILGTCFKGEAVEKLKFGDYDAVIPKVTGSAHICGINRMLIDPEDPLKYGFILR
ncbi:MAG: proline racemase family protein [Bacillota bacterium]|nr:proline racemase family protein [Bacillota bacterium]